MVPLILVAIFSLFEVITLASKFGEARLSAEGLEYDTISKKVTLRRGKQYSAEFEIQDRELSCNLQNGFFVISRGKESIHGTADYLIANHKAIQVQAGDLLVFAVAANEAEELEIRDLVKSQNEAMYESSNTPTQLRYLGMHAVVIPII